MKIYTGQKIEFVAPSGNDVVKCVCGGFVGGRNSGTFNGVDFGLAWFDPYRGKKGLQVHKRCLSDARKSDLSTNS